MIKSNGIIVDKKGSYYFPLELIEYFGNIYFYD
jgi:hypothetical protein